ncbi:hypothetical protein CSIRO_4086 [Bradyrhizobiaceae bacterium SG-6C]|nr:hypothetical protein CSIRO_4086 [Bradyrhizobiaceae bacterium SG-6C]
MFRLRRRKPTPNERRHSGYAARNRHVLKKRLWNLVSEGSRKPELDDHGQAIGRPMIAGNLARWTAWLTEGVSGCRGANAQDSRGRDKRKLQNHAILPR